MVESPTVRPKGGDTGGQGRDTVGLVGLKKKGRISNRVLTEPEPFAMWSHHSVEPLHGECLGLLEL